MLGRLGDVLEHLGAALEAPWGGRGGFRECLGSFPEQSSESVEALTPEHIKCDNPPMVFGVFRHPSHAFCWFWKGPGGGLGASWGCLGRLGRILGGLGGLRERSGRPLGASQAVLEASWRPLGGLLEASWGVLRRFVASWGVLGASWTRLGGVLGHLGGVLGRKRAKSVRGTRRRQEVLMRRAVIATAAGRGI